MSNIEALRNILSKYELEDTTEALEFLEAIEKEQEECTDTIRTLREEVKDYENDDEDDSDEDEVELNNHDFVGLDTINWSLNNGNLVIQQKMEYFIEALQKQNAVVPV